MLEQGSNPKYVLIAQDANDKLTIGLVGQPLHIIRTAREVLADKEMLSGFAPAHAAIIGVIGGMSVDYDAQAENGFPQIITYVDK